MYRIVELIIDEKDETSGIDAVSVVSSPAIESDFIALKKHEIELKATEYLIEENESQLINYLKATEMEVGLLLNFGKKPEVKRKVYSNNIEHIIKSLNN